MKRAKGVMGVFDSWKFRYFYVDVADRFPGPNGKKGFKRITLKADDSAE